MDIFNLVALHFWVVAMGTTALVILVCLGLVWVKRLLLPGRGRKRRRTGLKLRLRRRLKRKHHDPDMPAHLDTLVLAEQDIFIDKPAQLMGRPDEVYCSVDGRLVGVDTKTRKRAAVYLTDVIQLSVYAVLLAYSDHRKLPRRKLWTPTRPVADYGYVRCVTAGGTVWRRTQLFTAAEVVQLYHRRLDLEADRLAPSPARKAIHCRHCEFRDICTESRA